MPPFDSIIPCFGSRFTVVMLPQARRYHVHPLGTFHYFDWQKTDRVGISVGTSPQIVSSETARIGLTVDGLTRILPFDEGEPFAHIEQRITPLTTVFKAADPALPVSFAAVFRSAFYPQSFQYSTAPGYSIELTVTNPTDAPVTVQPFVNIPMRSAEAVPDGLRATETLVFPDGIDHAGIDDLRFEQMLVCDAGELAPLVQLAPGASVTVRYWHLAYIAAPTLNQQGTLRRFGYTTLWPGIEQVAAFWRDEHAAITRKGDLFESTITEAAVPDALKGILAAAFKGVACNAWWAEGDWFSVMEIGAYHATLDVDFQMALFFLQYWPGLLRQMLDQWAAYYVPGSGYMAHDVGQHLEATGNRYGGPGSAMKVEENCNYITLLHAYWRATGDADALTGKGAIIAELAAFLLDADTNGTGLPNRYADNTNDWGSGLITVSEEQSYHGVRLLATYAAVMDMAAALGISDELRDRCEGGHARIRRTLAITYVNDHYPIVVNDPASYRHYSMWTTHGLLYPLRMGRTHGFDVGRLRTDLIVSTQRTLREHGCVHSTVDVRGWLTQNLWRDCIAAYLGVDFTDHLRRYLGHGEYVSYEDTTILEVANELMVVPGAVAEHTHAGQTHDTPMVDGHPRPACGFGLLYALGGISYDALDGWLNFRPVTFPLRVALTHLADWDAERVPWVRFTRSIPNQDAGHQPDSISYTLENADLLAPITVELKPPYTESHP